MARVRLKPLHAQTMVITGASSGIGLATARMAADRGARVVLVSRDREGLSRICEDIRRDGGRADFIAADVEHRDEMRRVVDTVIDRYGGFDTFFNNAGVGAYAPLEEISDEDHERIFRTNYWGVVYGSTEALRHLRRRGGALINMGSISSEVHAPLLSAYTASKFAVKGFTDSLRLELMHDDAPVSLTLIQPSGIDTPFGTHARNAMDVASRVPPPVYAPQSVARAVLRAAEHPVRHIVVGGSGRAQIALARLFPSLSDIVFEKMFYATARDTSRPPQRGRGFHAAGSSGDVRGEPAGYHAAASLYTQAALHPLAAVAIGAGAALAGLGLAARLVAPRLSRGAVGGDGPAGEGPARTPRATTAPPAREPRRPAPYEPAATTRPPGQYAPIR